MRDYKALFILGATGDLARRKLLPVITNLYKNGGLVGVEKVYLLGRNKEKLLKVKESVNGIVPTLFEIVRIDLNNNLKDHLKEYEDKLKDKELIFYVSTPPEVFKKSFYRIGEYIKDKNNPKKIVIEKPFGNDLLSARELNNLLLKYFDEKEIYRIDHFLGKLAVQNIFSVRFSNYIFNNIWNKDFIDNVQISVLEGEGVEGRIGYYDNVGALKDMLQNHLLQIMAFIAMETPDYFNVEGIVESKIEVIKNIKVFDKDKIDKFFIKAQYNGYKKEVSKNTDTETFVAAKFFIENNRWEGVPFYLRTGKKLKRKETYVTIVFKNIPVRLNEMFECKPSSNRLVFEISPHERVKFFFQMTPPKGFINCPIENFMDIDLREYYKGEIPEPYELLIQDVLRGDRRLFISREESELSWDILHPVLNEWSKLPLYHYEPGTYGPPEADELIKADGRRWFNV